MPLYEYRCEQCGHRFEILQRLGEGAEGLSCGNCGWGGVQKQFSTFAANAGEGQAAVDSTPMGGCCRGTST